MLSKFVCETSHIGSSICWNTLLHFQAPIQRDFGDLRDADRAELVGEVEEEEGEGLTVTDINMDFNAQLSPEVTNVIQEVWCVILSMILSMTSWGHLGDMTLMTLRPLWGHSWTTLGPFVDHSWTTLWPLWDHSGTTLRILWDHSGTTVGSLWDHSFFSLFYLFSFFSWFSFVGAYLRSFSGHFLLGWQSVCFMACQLFLLDKNKTKNPPKRSSLTPIWVMKTKCIIISYIMTAPYSLYHVHNNWCA